jgi:ferredoxin/coenzyme F420-reducing hydrogenase delta subunit
MAVALDRVFPKANPWRHLGSLAFLCLVACCATGIYLYAVFDTSLGGAYDSGRALEENMVGRLMRGLHRYSADAFAVLTALHLVREALRGHFRFHRAWSWLSGLALVPLAWVAGITGFWLAWDQRALFSAMDAAEWLATGPLGLAAFVRNFAIPGAMNDRFFSLVVFVHIGVPLFTLAAMWAHVLRLSHVRAWPPRALGVPVVSTLAALALAIPATSLARADALAAPAQLAIDWFYFFPHALAAALPPGLLWTGVGLLAAALVVLPWSGKRVRPPAARVDLANCNGCARCAADCPFGAVVMVPRSDGRLHPRQAEVDPDLCASCGVCTGACPSASPFRRHAPLTSGIDLPQHTAASLREALDRRLTAGGGAPVVFACAPGGSAADAIVVECAAMVPPAFVQYALRHGASGVVIAACRADDCEHRVGERWVQERFDRRRAPALRESVPRERVRLVCCGSDGAMLERAVAELTTVEVKR